MHFVKRNTVKKVTSQQFRLRRRDMSTSLKNLDALRALFPHTQAGIYLNHAATGPLSTPVVQAMQAYLDERHRTNVENYWDFMPTLDGCLAALGRLVGSPAADVEFAPNTSYALNVLAQGFPWQAGDRIIVPGCEFPANVLPFMALQSRGVHVDLVPHHEGMCTLDQIEAQWTPRTRMLSISWVQFLSGYRADLEAIGVWCKDRGVLFCVDAIQGLGAMPMKVQDYGIDFLACGGHKWLMAPQGIGFFYATPALQDMLVPTQGWLNGPIDWEDFFNYRIEHHPDARRFRLGMLNNVGIAGLKAALDTYFEADPQVCAQRIAALRVRLVEGLQALGWPLYGPRDENHAAGIATIQHAHPDALLAYLKDHGVAVSVRNRKVRFAPTYYNTEAEIERVLDLVDRFAPVPTSVPTTR